MPGALRSDSPLGRVLATAKISWALGQSTPAQNDLKRTIFGANYGPLQGRQRPCWGGGSSYPGEFIRQTLPPFPPPAVGQLQPGLSAYLYFLSVLMSARLSVCLSVCGYVCTHMRAPQEQSRRKPWGRCWCGGGGAGWRCGGAGRWAP